MAIYETKHYGETIRVLSIEFHRNGVGGDGFVSALVEWRDAEMPAGPFVAVSFPGNDYIGRPRTPKEKRSDMQNATAVLNAPLLLSEVGIGEGNKWRGADHVGPAIVEAWHKVHMDGTLYPGLNFKSCPFNDPECQKALGERLVCTVCDGTALQSTNPDVDCPHCDGSGYEPEE